MKQLDGKVAAITGAASGIGRALALELHAAGAHLALSDIDVDGLDETRSLCPGDSRRVTTDLVDVASRQEVFTWADRVSTQHGRCNLVFNNAGVALADGAEFQSIEDFEWLMNINFWGVVHGTQAFLPHLRSSGEGHIVNISSVFGLVSVPSQSAYNAAKFGVRGYTDALRMELELDDGNISATTVHPGGIKTAIARNARTPNSGRSTGGVDREIASTGSVDSSRELADQFEKLAWTPADKAARQIIRAVKRNRRRALIGPDASLFDLTARLPAAVSQRLVMAMTRRQLGSELPKR
jgi:NAD(P)-dependent dehydrogenase (short-subunit alcohol dehydrogenase family)